LYLLTYLKIKYNKTNYKQKYNELLNLKEINKIKNIIIKFIHLYKSNGYKNTYLKEIIKKYRFFNRRYRYLLIIIIRIMLEYKNELKNENIIDFDDIILLSTNLVKNTNNLKYKYIIIDEFQDTSLIRYNLIREILIKTNANFLAVGDDYQSIYRFTGCDLYLFLNFKKYFDDSKIYKIQTTYRNSQQLINIAGNFIMKNKMQMKKNLKSHKELSKPIKIVYYKNSTSEFIKLIDYLYR
jgi:DNA helicase-4